MNKKEKIEKLDNIINKRLGKRANAIWCELKRDLFVAEMLRNHIQKNVVFKPEERNIGSNGNINSFVNMYYHYYCREMEEQDKRRMEMWLLENIDKERLKEWLESYDELKKLESDKNG